jgi:carboxymethylenebutenolidase
MGKMISVNAGDGSGSFAGYLAVPASGKGPGVVIGQEIFGINANMREVADFYAEEGYVALVPDLFWRQEPGVELGYTEADFARAIELFQHLDVDKAVDDIDASFNALRDLPEVQAGGLGYVGFCMGGKLAYLTATRTAAACCVGYYGMGIEQMLDEADNIKGRLVLHFAEQDVYCDARNGGMHYNKPAALMAHQRSIAALKQVIGPNYNLSQLWDKHIEFEFAVRDVPATMATMVAEPYVNHIPTMTGGVGYRELSRFYENHFVHANPPDMKLIPISRTVGASQIVDEFVMCFTHTSEIDWMLPDVAPTGKYVEIPMLGVIKFRGDKLCHEHIYWDQASVLVQIGLLDPAGLPVAGVETARKLLDEQLPSNTLMGKWVG